MQMCGQTRDMHRSGPFPFQPSQCTCSFVGVVSVFLFHFLKISKIQWHLCGISIPNYSCPGIRSGYPNKNNFNRTLFLMQTEAAPKLRPRKYEGHSCASYREHSRTLYCLHYCILHTCMHCTHKPTNSEQCMALCNVQYCDLDFLCVFLSYLALWFHYISRVWCFPFFSCFVWQKNCTRNAISTVRLGHFSARTKLGHSGTLCRRRGSNGSIQSNRQRYWWERKNLRLASSHLMRWIFSTNCHQWRQMLHICNNQLKIFVLFWFWFFFVPFMQFSFRIYLFLRLESTEFLRNLHAKVS